MDECRAIAKFILLSTLIGLTCSASISTDLAEPNLLHIVEDVIRDVENSTQKVIRVNTVDLPAISPGDHNVSESDLYNIQPLMPVPTYVSSKDFRKQKNISEPKDSTIIRGLPDLKLRKPKKPKQKHLQILYNQPGYDGKEIAKRMKVRIAPGAYPIYYVVAKTNGEFRKQPIKGFRNQQEMKKYFDKVERIGKFRKIDS